MRQPHHAHGLHKDGVLGGYSSAKESLRAGHCSAIYREIPIRRCDSDDQISGGDGHGLLVHHAPEAGEDVIAQANEFSSHYDCPGVEHVDQGCGQFTKPRGGIAQDGSGPPIAGLDQGSELSRLRAVPPATNIQPQFLENGPQGCRCPDAAGLAAEAEHNSDGRRP